MPPPRCCWPSRTGAETRAAARGSFTRTPGNLSLSGAGLAPSLAHGPRWTRLARQQRTLVFGQKGALVNTARPRPGQTEELPLATTPVEPTILAAKARATAL